MPKKGARQIMCLNHPGGQCMIYLSFKQRKVDHKLKPGKLRSAEREGQVDHKLELWFCLVFWGSCLFDKNMV